MSVRKIMEFPHCGVEKRERITTLISRIFRQSTMRVKFLNFRTVFSFIWQILRKIGYIPEVILGCSWSPWTAWSECTKTCGGGNIKRAREKLPGERKMILHLKSQKCKYISVLS